MTESEEFTVTPLSQFKPRSSLSEFLGQVRYEDKRGKHVRFQGDIFLLDGLDRAWKTAVVERRWQGKTGDEVTVRDLSPMTISECVGRVEDRLAAWSLTGDDGEDIYERLDRHFADQQARWLEQRREQAERERVWAEGTERAMREITERQARQYRATWGLPGAV
jgi:hypothetical protein